MPPFSCYVLGRELDLYNTISQCRLGVLEVYSQYIPAWGSDPASYEFFISRSKVTAIRSFDLFDTTAVKLK